MRVGLVDVDSHNFPSLPMMKLSAYHKSIGDEVAFARAAETYDRVYMSKTFTESAEPNLALRCDDIVRGGSGYDLTTKLPEIVEHMHPDYDLYPQFDFALGWLTRGCPRTNHTFCITPTKDGCKSVKVTDLSEFWSGQQKIVLLDQNLLACKGRMDLLGQLGESNVEIEFNGGLDVRFLDDPILTALRKLKVRYYHFAWDDPKEDLEQKFLMFKESRIRTPNKVSVYVLVNFWSSLEEDLHRIYTLRAMGYLPFVMVYDKQRYVDSRGRWLPEVADRFTQSQLTHFKAVQHIQRWCNSRGIIKVCPSLSDYEPYANWLKQGKPVPQ
jgi:hypothetical protein